MDKLNRVRIADVLKMQSFGQTINVKGWVRTKRGSKTVSFIALNDGTIIHNLQIVAELANFDEEVMKQITTGACISVNGVVVESFGQGQHVEIQAKEIEVLGAADPLTYPLQKKVIPLNTCAKLLISVHVPIRLALFFVFVTTWRWLSIRSFMKEDFIIFIRQSSPRQTVKAPDRCFR